MAGYVNQSTSARVLITERNIDPSVACPEGRIVAFITSSGPDGNRA
jgi:hypothetical protein